MSEDSVCTERIFKKGDVVAAKFEIIELLGSGAMGSVYRARNVTLQQVVALKFIHPQLVSSAELKARFLREAKVLSGLNNQNLVRLYSCGQTDTGMLFLALEYIEGEPLSNLLMRNGALKPQQAVKIASQISHGMKAVHEAGIVHRDLKPQNIMVTGEEGNYAAKIVDFGIAAFCESGQDQQLTATGVLLGSPYYMSPEQCRAQEIDARSDIYSLGCVMHEMLTGKVPFEGENALLIMSAHYSTPIKEVSVAHALPKSLEQIVLKCLHKHPDERFQSMNELADSLASIDWDTSRIVQVSKTNNASAPRHTQLKTIICASVMVAFIAGGLVSLNRMRSQEPKGVQGGLSVNNILRDRDTVKVMKNPPAQMLYYENWLKEFGAGTNLRAIADANYYRLEDSDLQSLLYTERLRLRNGVINSHNKLLYDSSYANTMKKLELVDIALRLSKVYRDDSETEDAILPLENALKLWGKDHSVPPDKVAEIVLRLSTLYLLCQRIEDAERLCSDSLRSSPFTDHKQSLVSLCLARAQWKLHKEIEARETLQRTIATRNKTGDDARSYLKWLDDLSDTQTVLQLFDQAQQTYSEALKVCISIKDMPYTVNESLWQKRGDCAAGLKHFKEADNCYLRAINACPPEAPERWRGISARLINAVKGKLPWNALAYVEQETYQSKLPLDILLMTLLDVSHRARRAGNANLEKGIMKVAANLCMKRGDTAAANIAVCAVSARLMQIGELALAKPIAEKALADAANFPADKKCQPIIVYAETLRYAKRGTEACASLTTLAEQLKRADKPDLTVLTLVNLARIYQDTGQSALASDQIKEAEKEVTRSGLPRWHFPLLLEYNLGQAARNNDDAAVEAVITEMLQAKMAQASGRIAGLRAAAHAYAEAGDLDKCIAYLEKALHTALNAKTVNQLLITTIKQEGQERCIQVGKPELKSRFSAE